MQITRRTSLVFAAVLVLSGLAIGVVRAEEKVQLQLITGETPLVGADVVVYLSDGVHQGLTDDEGKMTFEALTGRGFWVEVDGERLDEFYFVDQAPYQIDLSTVGVIEWPGR